MDAEIASTAAHARMGNRVKMALVFVCPKHAHNSVKIAAISMTAVETS